MVNICCHDETWLGYGTNVTIGFANQTPSICWDAIGICGHVVVVASVDVVASARCVGHVDCIKGNASGGCALALNVARFCGQGI